MKLAWVLVCVAGCSVFKEGTVAGKVESKGALGSWTLETGSCQSGQRENYFGAIAFGPKDSGLAIKLVKDPTKGWLAIVNVADTCKGAEQAACKAITLTSDTCSKLDVSLATTNMTVNDIKVIEGTVDLDCASGSDSLKGKLTFTHCH